MENKMLLIWLLLLTIASAQAPPAQQTALDIILEQTNIVYLIVIALMVVMVVLAAAAYVGGQFFGAETRAKASQWAQGMLVAVGIAIAALIILNAMIPDFMSNPNAPTMDVTQMITDLQSMSEIALVGIILASLVLAAAVYVGGSFFGAETRARATTLSSGLIAAAVLAAVVYLVVFQIIGPLSVTFFGSIKELRIYGWVIISVVFLVTAFILITYILSKFFKVPEWEAYLNVEMSNLMTSFLIVLFVVGLFGASTVISLLITGGAQSSPPRVAISYMQGTVADSALTAAMDVYKINACTSMLSTFSRRIGEYVLTQTYKVFPGLDTFVNITNVLGFTLLSLYSTVSVQIVLLYGIDATMLTFFMPAGLVLRFFPPTRDAGAFLISLAFGLQIVFPTIYIINKQIFDEIYSNEPGGGAYRSPTILIQSLCGPFKYGFWGYALNPKGGLLSSTAGSIPGGATVLNFLSNLVGESLLNFVSMDEFIPIMKHVAALSLLTLFMPALAMMVTIAFINAMTKFIVLRT